MIVEATHKVDVRLTYAQQKQIALDYICKQVDWKPEEYSIKDDGWVYQTKECHTTHSFDVTTAVRLASEEDRLINDIIKRRLFNL